MDTAVKLNVSRRLESPWTLVVVTADIVESFKHCIAPYFSPAGEEADPARIRDPAEENSKALLRDFAIVVLYHRGYRDCRET